MFTNRRIARAALALGLATLLGTTMAPPADAAEKVRFAREVYGTGGDDRLVGSGERIYFGGRGDDTLTNLRRRAPATAFIGGSGNDRYVLGGSRNVFIVMDHGGGDADELVLPNMRVRDRQSLTGTWGNNLLMYDVRANTLLWLPRWRESRNAIESMKLAGRDMSWDFIKRNYRNKRLFKGYRSNIGPLISRELRKEGFSRGSIDEAMRFYARRAVRAESRAFTDAFHASDAGEVYGFVAGDIEAFRVDGLGATPGASALTDHVLVGGWGASEPASAVVAKLDSQSLLTFAFAAERSGVGMAADDADSADRRTQALVSYTLLRDRHDFSVSLMQSHAPDAARPPVDWLTPELGADHASLRVGYGFTDAARSNRLGISAEYGRQSIATASNDVWTLDRYADTTRVTLDYTRHGLFGSDDVVRIAVSPYATVGFGGAFTLPTQIGEPAMRFRDSARSAGWDYEVSYSAPLGRDTQVTGRYLRTAAQPVLNREADSLLFLGIEAKF